MSTSSTQAVRSINLAALQRQSFEVNAVALGTALLRVALGAMFLAHGLLKVLVFTLPGTAAFFESVGFPGFFAYIVAPAEILGGLALIAGFQTRLVAAATLPLLFGVVTVHAGNGWVFSAPNGGWEFPVYLVVLAAAQVLLGGGAFSVDSWHRK